MNWIKTSEQKPEREPNARYSNPKVIVWYKGEVKILRFNHEHECWDDEDGDDYCCDIECVEYWMPLPTKPNMEKEKLIIEVAVGYMLKVLKNGKDTSKFHHEFAKIRHGNYDDFIDLVKGEKPFIVVASGNEVTTQNIYQKTHFDFAGLLLAGPSMMKFLKECQLEYGVIVDNDIPDRIFEKLALFEISLRMHANNNKLLDEKEDLIDVIKKLGDFKGLQQSDIDKLQKGREFLNMVKHFKNQFPTWKDGVYVFEDAYRILVENRLTVV